MWRFRSIVKLILRIVVKIGALTLGFVYTFHLFSSQGNVFLNLKNCFAVIHMCHVTAHNSAANCRSQTSLRFTACEVALFYVLVPAFFLLRNNAHCSMQAKTNQSPCHSAHVAGWWCVCMLSQTFLRMSPSVYLCPLDWLVAVVDLWKVRFVTM